MSVLDKLMFWKKDDPLAGIDLGKDDFAKDPLGASSFDAGQPSGALGDSLGSMNPNPGQSPPTPGMPQQSSFPSQDQFSKPPTDNFNSPDVPRFQHYDSQPQAAAAPSFNPQQELENKNMELISAKLDALRVSIDNLNQRLDNIEALARGNDHGQGSKGRYY